MIRNAKSVVEQHINEAADVMLLCPNGHGNPSEWDTCGECGARLGRRGLKSMLAGRPRLWTVVVTAVLVAVVGVLWYGKLSGAEDAPDQAATSKAATQQWWSAAQADVDELRSALDDTRSAITSWDRSGFNDACRRMHDAAAVGVPAHLPAPDPVVTAELSAGATDAHTASHMCLAVFENSTNNYDGEFTAALDQAVRHTEAAHVLVDLKLSTST